MPGSNFCGFSPIRNGDFRASTDRQKNTFLLSAYVVYVLVPEDLNSWLQLNTGELPDALPRPRECKREQPVRSSVVSSSRFFSEPSAEAVKIDQRACMGARPISSIPSWAKMCQVSLFPSIDTTLDWTVTVKPDGVGASWLTQIRIQRFPRRPRGTVARPWCMPIPSVPP